MIIILGVNVWNILYSFYILLYSAFSSSATENHYKQARKPRIILHQPTFKMQSFPQICWLGNISIQPENHKHTLQFWPHFQPFVSEPDFMPSHGMMYFAKTMKLLSRFWVCSTFFVALNLALRWILSRHVPADIWIPLAKKTHRGTTLSSSCSFWGSFTVGLVPNKEFEAIFWFQLIHNFNWFYRVHWIHWVHWCHRFNGFHWLF